MGAWNGGRKHGAWVLAWALGGLGCASGGERSAADRARDLMRTERAHTGNLVLNCEPEDADVYLDDVVQGLCTDFNQARGGLRVDEGPHRIEVRKDGYWPYTTYYEPGHARAVVTVRLRAKS